MNNGKRIFHNEKFMKTAPFGELRDNGTRKHKGTDYGTYWLPIKQYPPLDDGVVSSTVTTETNGNLRGLMVDVRWEQHDLGIIFQHAASVLAPYALTITEIILAVDTAPTGASLIIDVNKNGTTMYTTQGNRPTIAIDGTSATATDPDVTAVAKGDKISIDIDQIGSTIAGANLAMAIICEVA